ncbi:MAG: Mov34/MPN/PAD-1 family protein [Sphingomonas sp.]|uniref:Mov34/MPN/PAD-1 family protein n=1 Tax=Sphingomonas sp. TaxID=28214 RepID=UPI003F813898
MMETPEPIVVREMGMRLEISREALAGIRAAAAAAHPEEACGLLFGKDGLIDGWQETRNVAENRDAEFEIDPTMLFAALRAERAGGPKLVGYWHSHPNGWVEPSARDLDQAGLDEKIWIIVAGDDVAAWQATEYEIYDRVEHRAEILDGQLIRTVNYTSSGAKQKAFRSVPMLTGEVRHLVPRDKDPDIVPLIAEAGYPAIAPILDELMEWTADPNWPICTPLIDYLVTLGAPMIDPIRKVLRGDDDGHKFVCLRGMVRELPRDVQMLLLDDLQALAAVPSESGWETSVDAEARAILAELAGSGA